MQRGLEIRERRSVLLADLQPQSSFSRQVRGPGNGSGQRGHWVSLEEGRQSSGPFCTGWEVLPRWLHHPGLGDGEPVWLSAHIPALWDSQAHLRHLLNLRSVLTALPAEVGATVPSSHGRLLLDFWASCQDTWPGGHSAPASHSRPHAWACACTSVSMCVHV